MSNSRSQTWSIFPNNGGINWFEERINQIGAVVKRVVIKYDSNTEVKVFDSS